MKTGIQGFTLIELIMVIVIVGVLATLSTNIITIPTKSYLDLSRRTTLVDVVEMALRRMQRDIRRALPNSIRITGGGTVVEMLHTVDGGRYRKSGSGNILNFTTSDIGFDVIGVLQNFSEVNTSADQLVIYNLGSGVGQADAYQASNNNRSTLTASSSASTLTFTGKQFPIQSPQQRFFIVDTPISYRCDTVNKELLRYDGYPIAATQPNPPSVTGKLQANYVAGCAFSYAAGSASRSGLVTLELILTDDAGESARLIHQIHVDNSP